MADLVHVVCPHCDAVNRVPAERAAKAPACGKCHQPLWSGAPLPLNGPRFSRHLAKSDVPVLVDFWAPWCGPCKMMGPAFADAARQLEPRVRLAKVNTEEEQNLAGQFGIRSIPTMVLFQNGREKARISGAMAAGAIVDWVRNQI
ncbi:MAG: thioredoxin TrxC [Deltaproteobacteria bacterium]|nr:thioredoxin TrxC [Deltaproteobacteria bacterium]